MWKLFDLLFALGARPWFARWPDEPADFSPMKKRR